jgi:hypothetical protein
MKEILHLLQDVESEMPENAPDILQVSPTLSHNPNAIILGQSLA